MKAYGGVNVYIHIFLTSALAGGEGSASNPGHFTHRGETPGNRRIGGWMGLRAGQDTREGEKNLSE
jgi:hypothetical protein